METLIYYVIPFQFVVASLVQMVLGDKHICLFCSFIAEMGLDKHQNGPSAVENFGVMCLGELCCSYCCSPWSTWAVGVCFFLISDR